MTIRRLAEARRRLADARLYLVAGPPETELRDWSDRILAAVRGGVDAVQLRFKQASTSEVVLAAAELKGAFEAAAIAPPLLIVNDDVAAAVVVRADGVHLGQDDMTIEEARGYLGEGALVGVSTHTLDQARDAAARGADYLGFGAMFPTATKESIRLVGPDALAAVVETIRVPVFAIGGIDAANLGELTARGATRVAGSRAILGAADPEAAARALADRLRSTAR